MTVLITGASSGIGAEMAKYLSKLGYDLILVARREKKLLELKKTLETNVTIITMDLSVLNNIYKLYELTKDKGIEILINNAGYGLFGSFKDTDLNTELNMINLNIVTPHILTKLFLQDFLKKGKGYILNVCSSAGFMAGPKLNTYYATKNYLTKLTMAINEELRQDNSQVVVSLLCPGPTNTEFMKVAKGSFSIKEAKSTYVAKYGIDKLFKKKMIIIPTVKMKIGIFLLRFIPYRLQLIIIYKIQNAKLKKSTY